MQTSKLDENWKLLTSLINYSEGTCNSPPNVPNLSVDGQAYLATDEGRALVTRTVRAFEGTISLTRQYMKGPEKGSGNDAQMGGVIEKVIEALCKRMELAAGDHK